MFKWLNQFLCEHEYIPLKKFIKHSAKHSDMWYIKAIGQCKHCYKVDVIDAGLEFKDWHDDYKVNWFSDQQIKDFVARVATLDPSKQ